MTEESTATQETEESLSPSPAMARMAGIAAVTGSQELIDYVNKATSASPDTGGQQSQIKTETGASVNIVAKEGESSGANTEGQTEVSKNKADGSSPDPIDQNNGSETKDDITLEHDLFGGKFDPKKGTNSDGEGKESLVADLSTIDGITSLVKSKLGVESIDKLPEKIESLVAIQTRSTELEAQIKGIETLFAEMDPQLYQMVSTWRTGGNWKELANNSIDYGKDVKSYEAKTLVNSIMPGKISEAEWDEYGQEDCDPRVKSLIDLAVSTAQEKFTSKSESIRNESERMVTESNQRKERFEASIQASQAFLASKYPAATKTYLSDVAEEFKTGKVWSVFTNEDGTLREDAFLRLAMAKDGENLLQQSMKMIENRKESVGNQAILNHIADTPSGQNGGSGLKGTDTVRKEVRDKLDFINGTTSKKRTF